MAYTIFGGELRPAISLSIGGRLPVSDEVVAQNVAASSALRLPTYKEFGRKSDRLAVVGAGPSILDHKDAIRDFDGDIWAINGAWRWVKEVAPERDAVFLAVDPHPIVAKWAAGASRALLETRCDPRVFDLLHDAEVGIFDIGNDKINIPSGHSTATCAPFLAMRMGYRAVTLFGCESSFESTRTHAYFHENRPETLIVECGGREYLTAPDFYLQAQELSRIMREAPEFLREECGGLLRAMIADPELSIRWVSQGLADTITAITDPEPFAHVPNKAALGVADNLEAFSPHIMADSRDIHPADLVGSNG